MRRLPMNGDREKGKRLRCRLCLCSLASISALIWGFLFHFNIAPNLHPNLESDPCVGKYIYVQHLPPSPRFNHDLLRDCKNLNPWMDMCEFTRNGGFGPPLENVQGVFSDTGWYATNQFYVDIIFSERMKRYECLTDDSSISAAVFVPFYAGLDVARFMWVRGSSVRDRDAASVDLLDWLTKRPEWKVMGGKDHFLVAGRVSWDFSRLSDSDTDWGNKLFFLPAARNMTMLVVESSPWNSNDFAIPFPTYFHPAKDADVFTWQHRMRRFDREWLFSFVGADRPAHPNSIRGRLIHQCRHSSVCNLLECNENSGDSHTNKCHSPSSVMSIFQTSLFCLQPAGDSYTRRSAFDSMLAGCIPVFFHPGTAYVQYVWHLPKNYSTYSVFIPEDDIRDTNLSIEARLRQIHPDQVKIMRETLIHLIPSLLYAHPHSKLDTLKDAFDVTVEAIIHKVANSRKDIIDDDFVEQLSWKYALLEEGQRRSQVGPHPWDRFFSNPHKGEGDVTDNSSPKHSYNINHSFPPHT